MKVSGIELVLETKSGDHVFIPLPDGVNPEDLKVSGCTDGFDYRYIYDTSEAYEEEALVIEGMLEDLIETSEHDELIDCMREYIAELADVEDDNDALRESEEVQKLLTRMIKMSAKIFFSNSIDLWLKREYLSLLNEEITWGGFVGIFNDYNYSLAQKYLRRMWEI